MSQYKWIRYAFFPDINTTDCVDPKNTYSILGLFRDSLNTIRQSRIGSYDDSVCIASRPQESVDLSRKWLFIELSLGQLDLTVTNKVLRWYCVAQILRFGNRWPIMQIQGFSQYHSTVTNRIVRWYSVAWIPQYRGSVTKTIFYWA